jgi:hypothetical protein
VHPQKKRPPMSDYSELTKEELKEKCRERNLPVSGNKAGLLDRLEEDDKKKARTLQPVQSNKEKGKEMNTVQNKSSVQPHSRPAPRTSNQPTSSSSAAPQNAPAARAPAQRANVLYLPFISTLAQDRFTFQDHQGVESLLFVEMPKKIAALEKAINDAWIRRPTKKTGTGIYLHGIQGIGKSHLLYYEAWKLRPQPNYRVCYISDLGKISTQPENSFFQALHEAFPENPPKANGVGGIIPAITDETPNTWGPEKVEQVLKQLDAHCQGNNLKFVVVFDQINAIHNLNLQNMPFYRDLGNYPSYISKSGIVILSGSANNEFHGINFAGGHVSYEKLDLNELIHEISVGDNVEDKQISLGFTDEEFEAWIDIYKFFPDDPELVNVKHLTNLIPYELSLLLKMKNQNPNLSLSDLLVVYSGSRIEEFSKSHQLYVDKLHQENPQKMQPLLKIIRQMYFELKMGTQDAIHIFDQKFMYHSKDPPPYFYASTPLAFDAIMAVNKRAFSEDQMISLVTGMIDNDFRGDVIGRAFEKFVNWFWSITPTMKPKMKEIGQIGEASVREFKNFGVFSFKGSAIPKNIPTNPNMLYIPEVSNYPSIDYIFYSKDKFLYFFQLTVTPRVKDHMKIFDFVAFHDPATYGDRGVLASYKQKNVIESWRDALGMEKKTQIIRSIQDCAANNIHIVFVGYGVDDNFPQDMDGFWVADITQFDPLSRVATSYNPNEKNN